MLPHTYYDVCAAAWPTGQSPPTGRELLLAHNPAGAMDTAPARRGRYVATLAAYAEVYGWPAPPACWPADYTAEGEAGGAVGGGAPAPPGAGRPAGAASEEPPHGATWLYTGRAPDAPPAPPPTAVAVEDVLLGKTYAVSGLPPTATASDVLARLPPSATQPTAQPQCLHGPKSAYGNEAELWDGATLQQCGVTEGATLVLLSAGATERRPGAIQVFIKTLTGKLFPVFALPSNTVMALKTLILVHAGIPVAHQRLVLMHDGIPVTQLEDGRTIQSRRAPRCT